MCPTSLTWGLPPPRKPAYSGATSKQDTNPGTDDQEKGAINDEENARHF